MADIFKLHIGGLPLFNSNEETNIKKKLIKKFQKYGRVQEFEMKFKKDMDGNIVKRFAFLSLLASEMKAEMCVTAYNNTSMWQGCQLSVAFAKESFIDRLKKERAVNRVAGVASEANHNSSKEESAVIKSAPVVACESSDKLSHEGVGSGVKLTQPFSDTRERSAHLKSPADASKELSVHSDKKVPSGSVERKGKQETSERRSSIKLVSEDRRQSSIREQQDRWQKQRQIIQQALKSKERVNQRIVFSSSSESEGEEEGEGDIHSAPLPLRLPLTADCDDNHDFHIRPQYEGKAGQNLLKLQTAFNDDRFKMDERFKDGDASNDPTPTSGAAAGDSAAAGSEEKQKNLQILQQVVGVRRVLSVRQQRDGVRPNMLRYDPALSQHHQYEEVGDREEGPAALKTSAAPAHESSSVAPPSQAGAAAESRHSDLGDDKFYTVSTNLKQALSQGGNQQAGASFRISALFNSGVVHEAPSRSASNNLPPTQNVDQSRSKPVTVAATSEHMDYQEDGESHISGSTANVTNNGPLQKRRISALPFFFTKDDPRFLIGYNFLFGKPRSEEQIRKEWNEKRQKLQELYRTRRKRALKRKKQMERSAAHSSSSYRQNTLKRKATR